MVWGDKGGGGGFVSDAIRLGTDAYDLPCSGMQGVV